MLRSISMFVLLAVLALPAFAQDVCGLPACDIPAKMAELRAKNGDQRGMYALNLKAEFKDSTDQAVLGNLMELGKEMKALFTELKDEDWVVRAASDLINTSILNLARLPNTSGSELASYYRQLDNQTARYNLITFWHSQLAGLEDVEFLNGLVTFAAVARERSVEVGDEDWVSRAATTLITDITIKLTALDPVHEGVYDVQMSEASLALGTLAFDKMLVLDSSSSRNLVVVFLNSRLRVAAYTFSGAEIKGNEVSGLFLSNGDIAHKFSFTIDRLSGSVAGRVESTKFDAIDFEGTQAFSTRSVFAGKPSRAVTAADVIGQMKGEVAGIKGTLAVKSFSTNVYSATFTSTNGSVVMSFQGKFFPKNGVLSLTANDKIKLVLSLREKEGVEAWRGNSFSLTTGSIGTAVFAK